MYLTSVKEVDIVVMDMPLLDTRIGKDLIATFSADVVLQVLLFVAENERTTFASDRQRGSLQQKCAECVLGVRAVTDRIITRQ